MVRSIKEGIKQGSIYGLLLLTAAFTLMPFLWMIVTSLKTEASIFQSPPSFLPLPPHWGNYTKVFTTMPMGLGFLNSAKIAVLSTVGTLLTSSLAGFAFAKINFRGRNLIFAVLLATLMVPGQVTLIPLYILFAKMGWIDTHLPLIVPTVLLNGYAVFLFRQTLTGIPDSYIEAAKLDGCNYLQIYGKIILPLCKPILITLGLFTFVGSWNNFLGSLIFLNTDTKFTIPLLINSFRTVYYVDWGLLMAASCVALLPIIILYLFTQRFLVEQITLAGIKG